MTPIRKFSQSVKVFDTHDIIAVYHNLHTFNTHVTITDNLHYNSICFGAGIANASVNCAIISDLPIGQYLITILAAPDIFIGSPIIQRTQKHNGIS